MASQLTGLHILVTRPAKQADNLCHLLEALGAQVWRLPLLDIVPLEEETILTQWLSYQEKLDFAVCVSVNAVHHAIPLLQNHGVLRPDIQWLSVGRRTGDALHNYDLTPLCAPPPFNSESLLSLPILQAVQGKRILILRGDKGREVLSQTLCTRGAQVNYLTVYRRVTTPFPTWINEIRQMDAIIITSEEGLRQLFNRLGQLPWLSTTPLVLMSPRLADKARHLGSQAKLAVATQSSDEGLVAAVLELYDERYNDSSHTKTD